MLKQKEESFFQLLKGEPKPTEIVPDFDEFEAGEEEPPIEPGYITDKHIYYNGMDD